MTPVLSWEVSLTRVSALVDGPAMAAPSSSTETVQRAFADIKLSLTLEERVDRPNGTPPIEWLGPVLN